MSVIGGQNTPTTNGLAYIIDFNNNYISGSSTVTPILYVPTASQFTGSVPNLVNGQVQFTGSSVLRSFQTFPGFSATQGNMTLMFSGESKNTNVLFTQDGTVAVVSTTSSIGYGVPAGNLGRNFPNTGFDHVTLRFSSASVDCFINGIPVSASGIFPTVPSSSTFNDFKIGGNYINAWTGSFSGSLGQLMVYNRVLSDDEIYSNYLIQARRYGLPEIAKPYTVDSSVYVYTQAAGITGSSTISALNTFVSGLKSAGLWDKMIAIYPFIGTSPSSSRLNLKDVSLNTTQVNYSGSWSTSLSGSYNNNTSSYGILSNITATYVHPLINSQSIHLSYLSYDTPVSGGYLMGAETGLGASGGVISYANGRVYHTFLSGSGSFTPTDPSLTSVEVLVVGGGGGGGTYAGGGGGAGGLIYSSSFSISLNTPLQVVVGNGGRKATSDTGGNTNGENSVFGSITAIGGGRGGVQGSSDGKNGGSGGGSTFGSAIVGTGTLNQGNNGGKSTSLGDGGGGGGAGTVGQDSSNGNTGGNGGSGSYIASFATIAGSPAGWFAGGGGGSGTPGGAAGIGGIGGGGNGEKYQLSPAAQDGAANTGGGGGGSYLYSTTNGGNGGSGIVIVSYPIITRSTSIQTTPTFISASANDTRGTGLTTGGPLGMITVSRTGSTAMALWKNRVPTKATTRASASINLNFNLNSLNASNTSISASQNTVAYASVGAGLTDDEVYTYYGLVDTLQTNLGRGPRDAGAFISTWDTRLTGSGTSNSSSVILPISLAGTASVSWGDGTTSIISSSAQADVTHSYSPAGIYTINISGQHRKIISGVDKRKIVDVSQWGTGSWANDQLGVFWNGPNFTGTANDAAVAGNTLRLFFAGNDKDVGIGNWNVSNTSNFNAMFSSAGINQDLGSWDMRSATNLSQMFYIATAFNNAGRPTINNWRFSTSSAVSINAGSMFAGARSFNQPIGDWNTDSFTDMSSMFTNLFAAVPFNQNIGNWNVSRVTTMNNLLTGTPFNNGGSPSINNWRPVSCSNFSSMFASTPFNQPIGNWPISASGVNMSSMFLSATAFNQNIGSWDISRVTNMTSMFQSATAFNNSGSNTINNWRPVSCSAFNNMFQSATAFNQPIGNWPISASNVNMFRMFYDATAFNQNIGSWDVSRVTNMSGMFLNSTAFNNSGSNTINNWRPISCSNFSTMFQAAGAFNQPIGNWPLSASSIDMSSMFYGATAFNQNIGSWDVSKVTTMYQMFRQTSFNNSGSSDINNWRPVSCSTFELMFAQNTVFNQPIGNWTLSTSSNVNMSTMFSSALSFNQNVGSWNVSKVTNMSSMFEYARDFNNGGSSDINNWTPISCSNFSYMFYETRNFNQPVGNWTLSTSSIVSINMSNMFDSASAFDQDISTWNVSRVTNLTNFMNRKSTYSHLNNIYSDTGWIRTELRPSVTARFTGTYSTPAVEGRALLTRTYATGSITAYSSDGPNLALTCSFNHNVVAGNKVFISGSSDPSINGIQIVQATSSATMLTLALPISPPAVTGDKLFTGYGWTITGDTFVP